MFENELLNLHQVNCDCVLEYFIFFVLLAGILDMISDSDICFQMKYTTSQLYWLLCLGRWAAWCAWAGLGWSGLGWAGLPDLPPPPPHLWVCLVWFGLSLSQYYCTNCTIKHWQYDIYYLQNIHEIKVSWWNNYKCINYLYKTKPLTFDLHVKFKSKLKYKENIILPPKSLFCPLIGCSG